MDFSKMSFGDAITEVLKAQENEKVKDRILGSLNIKPAECDEESRLWAEYIYKKQEKYLNPYDGVHGGIACTLVDSCMGTTLCAATQELPSTTDLQTSFLRPMTGEAFRIRVDIKMIGRQLAAANCDIFDETSGKLCAQAMGKFILVKKDILADEEASKSIRK